MTPQRTGPRNFLAAVWGQNGHAPPPAHRSARDVAGLD